MGRDAVVFIEFQREWLDPAVGRLGGMMQDRAQFEAAVVGARWALRVSREAGDAEVVHVPFVVSPGYPELGDHPAGLFGAIPHVGTWMGATGEFADGFEPAPGEFVVRGRVGASAFASSNLEIYLRQRGVTQVFLAGFALHVCIESTLREGHDRGFDMVVLEDACSAFTTHQRDYVLAEVVHHFGRHLTVEQFVEARAAVAA